MNAVVALGRALQGPLTAISFVYISAMPAPMAFEVVAVDFRVL